MKDFEQSAQRFKAVKLGNTLLTYEQQLEDSIISSSTTPVTINGISGLCVNASYTFASAIGHKLAKESSTFGATWSQMEGGLVKWSLRSI